MRKIIALYRAVPSERKTFADGVLNQLMPLLAKAGPAQLKVTLTMQEPPAWSVIPYSRNPLACVSIWGDAGVAAALTAFPGFVGLYEVTEGLPRVYNMDWPVETPSPGACMLTLFKKKKDISYQLFLDRWHYGHTPLSLKLYPLWNYVRNVVVQSVDARTSYDGIVEEYVRDARDLQHSSRFFGPPHRRLFSMVRTYFDVRRFLDYPSIETYLVEEWWYIKQNGH